MNNIFYNSKYKIVIIPSITQAMKDKFIKKIEKKKNQINEINNNIENLQGKIDEIDDYKIERKVLDLKIYRNEILLDIENLKNEFYNKDFQKTLKNRKKELYDYKYRHRFAYNI